MESFKYKVQRSTIMSDDVLKRNVGNLASREVNNLWSKNPCSSS